MHPLPTRLGLAPVFALALAALAAGCGSGSSAPAASSSVSAFRNGYVSFRHPTAWRPLRVTTAGVLHFDPMLYLSTQPGHDPCRTAASGTTTCGWPVGRLGRDGVLVVWENRGFPGWSLATQPGTPLRVGGRQAKRTVARPGPCAAIGADETIEVAIARPLAENWTEVTACLRGPDLAPAERQLASMLASTRFRAP